MYLNEPSWTPGGPREGLLVCRARSSHENPADAWVHKKPEAYVVTRVNRHFDIHSLRRSDRFFELLGSPFPVDADKGIRGPISADKTSICQSPVGPIHDALLAPCKREIPSDAGLGRKQAAP